MKIYLGLVFFLCTVFSYGQNLHLYGGKDHDDYLGCLNCTKYDSNSIWNEYGKYGSIYESKSIWNKYGTYGNEYNFGSPWNPYSNDTPIVVDKDGKFYGYFTINKYKSQRCENKVAKLIYENYKEIMKDVGKAYDAFF